MKLTILYDNEVFLNDLKSDWGFSCFIEKEGVPNILFDTGANGSILLSNMKRLDVEPSSIDDVFISHSHHDHIGGLSKLLKVNSNVKIWLPHPIDRFNSAKKVNVLSSSTKIYEGVWSTGELEGIEQSLCVETGKGVLVITGCSHPKMESILGSCSRFGSLYGIVGGLHGTRPKHLRDLDFVCPTHCTKYKEQMKKVFSDRFVEGGVGRVIEI